MPSRIKRSPEEIALLLTMRPGKTSEARSVSERVLFRVECAMWIAEALKEAV